MMIRSKQKIIRALLSFALAGSTFFSLCAALPMESASAAVDPDQLGNNRYVSDFDNRTDMYNDGEDVHAQIVEEGTILLKNEDDALPLKEGAKISMFGKGSIYPGYSCDGILKNSLINSGFSLNPELTKFYADNKRSPWTRGSISGNTTIYGYATGETPVQTLLDDSADIPSTYSDYNDAAIVVISRTVGEGHDNPRTMMWDGNNIRNWSDDMTTVVGARSTDDHYMQLDQNETDLLAHVCENFDKVVVLINSGSQIETGFLDDPGHYAYHEEIKGALWVGNYGWGTEKAIKRIAAILKGDVSPSGHTTDTWSRDYKLDPVWQNYGNNLVKDGNLYQNLAGTHDYTNRYVIYKEGIYVGYRYWETRAHDVGDGEFINSADGASIVHGTTTEKFDSWYSAHVVYPFGYGLSYTTFDWEILDQTTGDTNGTISVKVKVTNTGNYAGKDVVQLYYTPPYTSGGIEKAHVVLGAFEKTKTLAPNESQTLTLSFDVRDMASYDYSDANGNGFKGYELEKGEYVIRLMRNAHEETDSFVYNVANDVRYETSETTGNKIENRFDEVSNYLTDDLQEQYLSRSDWEGTFPEMSLKINAAQWIIDGVKEWGTGKRDPAADEDQPYYSTEMPTTGADNGLVLNDMFGVDYDDPKWDLFLDQLTKQELVDLATKGAYWTGVDIERLGIQKVDSEDCPIEFHPVVDDNKGQYNNYGGESLLAATWNKELSYKKGRSFANNGLWGNGNDYSKIGAWYAPAVNIHRSPFGGRNYEYYSEDGLLTGEMAANVVKGASSLGLITYVKHFALNDQETNRLGVMTWANEQSMRELYFKPFEICVKEGEAIGIMSSLNRIGTEWTGGSYRLLTEILREEWGFKGTVVTDSFMNDPLSDPDQMIRAGGDLALGRPTLRYNTDSATTYTALRKAAHNICYTLSRSMALNFGKSPTLPEVFTSYVPPTLDVGIVGAKFRADIGTAVISPDAYPNASRRDIVYTLTEDSNPLPAGLTMNESGIIEGIPEEECANYTVKIQATYKSGKTTAEIVFNVVGADGAIVFNPESSVLKTASLNKYYNASIADSAYIYMPDATEEDLKNLPPIVFSLAEGSILPSGLKLSSNGKISGVPDKGCVDYDFTVVANAEGFFEVEYDFTISVLVGMNFTGKTLEDGKYGVPYFDKVTKATCENEVTYRLKDGSSLPGGLELTESGYIVGKPTQTVTDYKFIVEAVAEFAPVKEAEYTITIGLKFGNVELGDGQVGKAYDGTLGLAIGASNVSYTIVKGKLPDGVTMAADGTLSGTPTKAGMYSFIVRAEAEGKAADEVTVKLWIGGTEAKSGCNGSISNGGMLLCLSIGFVLPTALIFFGRKKRKTEDR